jgi:glycosyltransferase XagB
LTIQGQGVHVASSDGRSLPIEIAFLVRHDVPFGTLRQAADISRRIGISADQVLIRGDFVLEATFYRALADELGLPFLNEDSLILGSAARFPESALYGLGPLPADGRDLRLALAPSREALAWLLSAPRPLAPGLAITTPSCLNRAVLRAKAGLVVREAANGLAEAEPHRSCRDGLTLRQRLIAGLLRGGRPQANIVRPDGSRHHRLSRHGRHPARYGARDFACRCFASNDPDR